MELEINWGKVTYPKVIKKVVNVNGLVKGGKSGQRRKEGDSLEQRHGKHLYRMEGECKGHGRVCQRNRRHKKKCQRSQEESRST